jgi:hypothetical protein
VTIDRERELIRQYDDAHRAYLEALEVVRARVFGRAEAVGRGAKSQVTKARHRLADSERELQDYWSTQAIAQEVSR